jgi:hypothetical protein
LPHPPRGTIDKEPEEELDGDSQPKLDYKVMDNVYEFRNPYDDAVSQRRKLILKGTLVGYWVSSDSQPPNSDDDDDSDEDIESLEAPVYELIKSIEEQFTGEKAGGKKP